jgi:hypothetical protein
MKPVRPRPSRTRANGLRAAHEHGAETVETAVKVAPRWSYKIKDAPHDQATIIYMTPSRHAHASQIGLSTVDGLSCATNAAGWDTTQRGES